MRSSIWSHPRRAEWLILAILVTAALAIRIYRLGSFPDTVLADEADNAQASVQILHGHPPQNGFFGLDWTDQPALSAYKEAGFIALFGFTITAMRLSSAVISAIALVPFYFLLRRQLAVTASMLATMLLATSVWYLNFSRSGWNVIDVCLYLLAAMWFVLRGIDAATSPHGARWKGFVFFAGAGFFCALGLYAYPPGRAITVAMGLFVPVALAFNRSRWRPVLLGFVVLFAVEAAVFAPQAAYIAKHWQTFTGRTRVVSVLNSPQFKAHPVATMESQLKRNLRGPWDGSVNNTPQYTPVGEPQLDRVTGMLALGGMMLTLLLARFRGRQETWLWWLMLLAGWTSTQVLSVATPNGVRGIGLVPELVFFAGVGIDVLVSVVRSVTARITVARRADRFLTGVVIAAVTAAAVANVKHYIDWQSRPNTRQARYLYVTAREFPAWSAQIVQDAEIGRTTNVGAWREAHPLRDIANPYTSQ